MNIFALITFINIFILIFINSRKIRIRLVKINVIIAVLCGFYNILNGLDYSLELFTALIGLVFLLFY